MGFFVFTIYTALYYGLTWALTMMPPVFHSTIIYAIAIFVAYAILTFVGIFITIFYLNIDKENFKANTVLTRALDENFDKIHAKAFFSIIITSLIFSVILFYYPLISILAISISFLLGIVITKCKVKKLINYWNENATEKDIDGSFLLTKTVKFYQDIGLFGGLGYCVLYIMGNILNLVDKININTVYQSQIKNAKFIKKDDE